MTTALAIITQAFRESNILPIGRDLVDQPNGAAMITEGLEKLNDLIASVFGNDVGERLTDWPVGALPTEITSDWNSDDWAYPPVNARLLITDTSAQTIYLPPVVDNGARIQVVDLTGGLSGYPLTLDGNGRLVDGAATASVSADDANSAWLYRGDLGQWKLLSTLASGDEMPFPQEFNPYFEIMTAARLNPRYGRAMDEQTTAMLRRTQTQLKSAYRQKVPVRPLPGVTQLTRTMGGGATSLARAGRFGWMQ